MQRPAKSVRAAAVGEPKLSIVRSCGIDLSEAVRTILLELDLSYAEIAGAIGASRSSIDRWSKGELAEGTAALVLQHVAARLNRAPEANRYAWGMNVKIALRRFGPRSEPAFDAFWTEPPGEAEVHSLWRRLERAGPFKMRIRPVTAGGRIAVTQLKRLMRHMRYVLDVESRRPSRAQARLRKQRRRTGRPRV